MKLETQSTHNRPDPGALAAPSVSMMASSSERVRRMPRATVYIYACMCMYVWRGENVCDKICEEFEEWFAREGCLVTTSMEERMKGRRAVGWERERKSESV